MTLSYMDPRDELFAELQKHYSDDQIVELTATIALENFRSKFNHALGIPSQHFWTGQPES